MTLICSLFVPILCQFIIIGKSCLTVNLRDDIDLAPTTVIPVNNTNAFTFQGNAVSSAWSSYQVQSICSGDPGEVNTVIINQCVNTNQYNIKLQSIDFNYQFSIGHCQTLWSSRLPIFHLHLKDLNGTFNDVYIKVFNSKEVNSYCWDDTNGGIASYSPLQTNHIDIDMDLGNSDYQFELEFRNRDYNCHLYYDTLSLQINWSTENPTTSPSKYPTSIPSLYPSIYPTNSPTGFPSVHPTTSPSKYPSDLPTLYPSDYTNHPTVSPTESPLVVTETPSKQPTDAPIISPDLITTSAPTSDLHTTGYASEYTSTNTQNIDITGAYTTEQEAVSASEQSNKPKLPTVLISIGIIICCCIVAFFLIYRKCKQQNKDLKNNDAEILSLTDNEVGKAAISITTNTQLHDDDKLSITNRGKKDMFDQVYDDSPSNDDDDDYDADNNMEPICDTKIGIPGGQQLNSFHFGYMDYNRVDEKDKDDADNEIYHEKQEWEMCLVHALNGLLQTKQFAVKRMNEICKELAPNKLINPHKSLLQTGNYDANVLMMALTKVNIDVEWFDARKANQFDLNDDEFLKYLEPDNKIFVGFILNNPQKAMFKMFTRRHWIAIKQINDIWYNLDSKLATPHEYKNANEVNAFLVDNLSKNNAELMICRMENKYITTKVEMNCNESVL